VRDDDYSGDDYETRARLAAERPNSYTFYELTWTIIGGAGAWVVNNFRHDGLTTVLGAVYWLRDRFIPRPAPEPTPEPTPEPAPTPAPEPSQDDSQDRREDEPDYTEQIIVPPAVENIDDIKTVMEENNLVVYSPSNSRYSTENDAECVFYVRNISTALLNVYLDGKRLSENQINFRIEILPNGLFKIVLSRELMKSLKKGKHELLLDFYNIQNINVVIEVE
jgi:hypothetical protein